MLINAILDIYSKNKIVNLVFKCLEMLVFGLLFIPSLIMLQVAVPEQVFVLTILCALAEWVFLSDVMQRKFSDNIV